MQDNVYQFGLQIALLTAITEIAFTALPAGARLPDGTP
jgi:hypothetical protein